MFNGLSGGFGKLLGGIGIMATLTVAAHKFYAAMEAGGALVDLSAQTGVAVDKLMVLQLAFEQAGMAASDVQPVVAKLQKSIAEAATGNATAAAKFKTIGIAIKDIQGLSADEQLAKVGEAISKIENPAQRSAMAMEVFGKSGAKLLSVFSSGGLEDVQANIGNQAQLMVQNAGIFDRATDVLNTAGSKMQGFFVGMASEIMPPLMGVVDAVNSIDFSQLGQGLGDSLATWIVYFQNFGTVGDLVKNTLTLAFQVAVNFLNDAIFGFLPKLAVAMKIEFATAINFLAEAFDSTFAGAYISLKIAFGNAINFLGKEVSVVFAKAAAGLKAMLPGGGNMQDEIDKAEAKVRAQPNLFDTAKLKNDLLAIQNQPITPVFDLGKMIEEFDALNYEVVKPVFDTTDLEERVQADKDTLETLKAQTAATSREKYATPVPLPAGAGFIPKTDEKPVGAIVSSMAKIGGDMAGPQTGALDVARQQLQAQQRTADNTAKLVAQMNKQVTSTSSPVVYQ
jgi:hypothetical protein